MKKILALLLCALLMLSLLTGCGERSAAEGASAPESETPQSSAAADGESAPSSQEAVPTPAPVPVVTDDYVDTTPRDFALAMAPESYLKEYNIYNSEVDSSTREDVVVGDFAYRVYG